MKISEENHGWLFSEIFGEKSEQVFKGISKEITAKIFERMLGRAYKGIPGVFSEAIHETILERPHGRFSQSLMLFLMNENLDEFLKQTLRKFQRSPWKNLRKKKLLKISLWIPEKLHTESVKKILWEIRVDFKALVKIHIKT